MHKDELFYSCLAKPMKLLFLWFLQDDDVILINCLWCCEPGFSDKHVQEFILKERSDEDHPDWFSDAYTDLFSCFDCVEEFHQSLSFLLDQEEASSHLPETAYQSNLSRITNRLTEVLHLVDDVKIDREQNANQLKGKLEVPLLEMLGYPRLLLNASLCDLFIQALKLLLSTNQEITQKKLPGVYLLLVHPDETVSKLYPSSINYL